MTDVIVTVATDEAFELAETVPGRAAAHIAVALVGTPGSLAPRVLVQSDLR